MGHILFLAVFAFFLFNDNARATLGAFALTLFGCVCQLGTIAWPFVLWGTITGQVNVMTFAILSAVAVCGVMFFVSGWRANINVAPDRAPPDV